LTAFTLLVGILPTVIPIHEYTFRFDRLTAGFESSLLTDTVTELAPTSDGDLVHTQQNGGFRTANVVVANPDRRIRATARPRVREGSACGTYVWSSPVFVDNETGSTPRY
jgi:hypothetical protein